MNDTALQVENVHKSYSQNKNNKEIIISKNDLTKESSHADKN